VSEPRFFCRTLHPGLIELDETEARHARRSLRLRPGDAISLFDGCGRLARARLAGAGSASAPDPVRAGSRSIPRRCLVFVEAVISVPPPARTLTLITAACRGPRLDWMIEKCTELGVTRIVLAAFERSVVRPAGGTGEKLARTALEACKQCRRVWLPEIAVGASLTEVIGPFCTPPVSVAASACPRHPSLLVCEPQSSLSLAGWLHAHSGELRHLAAVIGPEGGLSDTERAMLSQAGAQPVRLAEHILRVETAAVAVAANWAARGET
jgi:16S rRNA (uracil1498-N3)-methyltransferase